MFNQFLGVFLFETLANFGDLSDRIASRLIDGTVVEGLQ